MIENFDRIRERPQCIIIGCSTDEIKWHLLSAALKEIVALQDMLSSRSFTYIYIYIIYINIIYNVMLQLNI